MTYKDILTETLHNARDRFVRAFEGVTAEEANRFPVEELAPSLKSMSWLTWHTALVIDVQISHLAGWEPIWTGQGWRERFDFEEPKGTDAWMPSLEKAKEIQVTDTSLLLDYLDAAVQIFDAYLEILTEADLEDIIDTSYVPAVTRGVRIASTVDDAVMHSGQVVYARRLLGKEG